MRPPPSQAILAIQSRDPPDPEMSALITHCFLEADHVVPDAQSSDGSTQFPVAGLIPYWLSQVQKPSSQCDLASHR
jgi:hypothetical protein